MSTDPSRLYSALLNTGLQQKDNALYQVIYNLITNLNTLSKQTASGATGATGATGAIGPQGGPGSILFPVDGEDAAFFPPIVGPQGNTGPQGLIGSIGSTSVPIDGLDGEQGLLQIYPVTNLSGIIQTVQVTSTSVVTGNNTNNGTYIDVTGLNLTITPVSGSNQVRLQLILNTQFQFSGSGVAPQLGVRFINVTSGATVATFGNVSAYNGSVSLYTTIPVEFIDSPASINPINYKVQISLVTVPTGASQVATNVVNSGISGVSTFTAQEILPAGVSLIGQTGATGPQGPMGIPSLDGMDGENAIPIPGIPGPAGPSANTLFTRLFTSATGTQNDYAPGISGNTIEFWSGAADVAITGLASGNIGQIYIFKNTGTKIATFPNLSGGSSAGSKFTNTITSGPIPVAPKGSIKYIHDGTTWQLIAHSQGTPITPAYAAGNFSAGAPMTWGVDNSDIQVYQYVVDAMRGLITIFFGSATTTIGGTVTNTITVSIPGGFSSGATQVNAGGRITNAGSETIGLVFVNASGTVVNILKYPSLAVFTLDTNGTTVQFTIVFQIT